ncbi:MAG: Holliday junction resolvase RuvX [Gammaproteobacteria bacterium]
MRLTLLCFDYGTKRIGVAVGQTLTGTATPLETITVSGNRPDWGRIETLIDEWQADALVVGEPLTLRGERQELGDAADRFCRQLTGRFNLTVHRADERLTTREARTRHPSPEKRDDIAAQIILEGWLQQQSTGPDQL